ncbi:uncharacterized protein LOC126786564 [Argentina anserina]|uniref:uncharacterized protein LOC126786564 n=1 Tax=Argentina anserina TaxID=57926 RepID=UPI0021764B2D|nr:uncharacterized protein LOC126786564 [Potentilla anserina]
MKESTPEMVEAEGNVWTVVCVWLIVELSVPLWLSPPVSPTQNLLRPTQRSLIVAQTHLQPLNFEEEIYSEELKGVQTWYSGHLIAVEYGTGETRSPKKGIGDQ